jgi:hypothetical protein
MTSMLDGDEWSALHPHHFNPGSYSVGGWLGPRTGVDVYKKRKMSLLGIEGRTAQSIVLVFKVSNTKFSFNAGVSIAELARSSVAMNQRRRRHNGAQSWDKKSALYN